MKLEWNADSEIQVYWIQSTLIFLFLSDDISHLPKKKLRHLTLSNTLNLTWFQFFLVQHEGDQRDELIYLPF